jgi:hypothetical protein
MPIFKLLLVSLLQTPAATTVIVGLNDGQTLVLTEPQFSGFIAGDGGEAVLFYRQTKFHGQAAVKAISRIDFGEYQSGEPYALTVTLRNGRKLEVQSEYRNFVTIRGNTEFGPVRINHPEPLSSELKLTTRKPDRGKDLTIRYLEFPASQ